MLDVLCVGSATLDTIALVPDIPGPDERVEAEVFATAGGGPAATAAVTLARLGVRVGLAAVVGDDEAGAAVRAGLAEAGVRLDWLTVRPGIATARSIVLVSRRTGERTIAAQRAPEPDGADLPLDRAAWVHVDQTGLGPVDRVRRTQPLPGRLSIDGGNGCDLADLAGVAVYAPSVAALRRRYPAAQDADAAAELAVADGAEWVVATDGARGATVRGRSVAASVPGFAVAVVSTLGAGDVFHGALLAALVRGAVVPAAAEEASAAAALSCRALDGRSAIPARAELDDFLSRERARARPGPARTLEGP